jgi:hypothetical protein
MNWRGESNAIAELKSYWHQWTTIVELFARRRRGRKRVDFEDYTALHNELIQTCQALENMVDADEKPYFRSLEQLALPWVAPSSFRIAEREILSDLLTQCRRIERELGCRLFLTAAACVAFLLVFWTVGTAWAPMLQRGRTWSDAVKLCIERTRYVHHILIPGILVVSASSYIVSKTARS